MPVITISGKPGSGSTTIAKLLAEKLNIKHFSAGRMWKDIARGKIKEQYYFPIFNKLCSEKNIVLPELKAQDDSTAVLLLWNTEIGKSLKFNEALDNLQKQLAQEGNIVFDGKLSIHMIPDATISVWLKGQERIRAKRLAERDDKTIFQAITMLQERETKERKEWENMYGFDYFTQEKEADLVVDSTEKSLEEVSDLILRELDNKL